MTRFLALLLWSCLLPLSVWAAEEPVMPLGTVDFASQAPYLTVNHAPSDVTSIALLAPNVVVEDKSVDYRQFKVFGIPGEPFRADEGYPTVPHVTRFYRIPNLGSVDLVVRDAQFDVVDNVDVAPYQMDGAPAIAPVATVDGWFPATVAELSEPMIMRDFRVVTVTVNPVQVNPSKRQVRIYRSINVDVVPNDRPGVNEITNPRPPSGAYVSLYRSLIANLDDQDLINATTRPGSYLIICGTSSTYRPWADSLFEWKTRKGFRVVIDARGNWQTSTIISAVQTMYASADPPLEYVCLVGDPVGSGVPTSSSRYDHDYGRGTNGDEIEDIAVGRLSGSGVTEMQTIIAKIMGYERTPWMADTMWYHRAYLTGDISGHPSPAISNYRMSQWGAWQFRKYTCINESYVDYSSGSFPTSQTVQQFNRGICFFSWRGSYIGQADPSAPGQTNPGWKLPICSGITCNSNEFANGSGFMESFLTAGSPSQPKGGVAAVGTSTTATHQPPNICLSGGLIYNIANLGVEHFGTAVQGAKFWLFRTFLQQSSFAAQFSELCNAMGDPGLSIWTCVPTILNVTYPAALNVGARQISITVMDSLRSIPVANAIVTAWKRGADSTYALGLTNASGQVTLPLGINATGNLLLTVTKQNVKPFLATIPCVQADNMVMYSSYGLDDDNAGGTRGNGDGVLNPGETMDMSVWLKNFGTSGTIHNITATLTSNNARVQVVNNTSVYPDLTPNQESPNTTAFRIQVSPLMQNNEKVQLTLTVNSNAGPSVGCIELSCAAPSVVYVNSSISGFAPGSSQVPLRVTLRNAGQLAMTGTTAHLSSLSPFVQVDDPDVTYGDIAVGSTLSNASDPFLVSARTIAFRGHQAPMLLVTTTADGMVDTATFVLAVGTAASTDPSGPDGYGYYAYDNTDAGYDTHPTFSYVNIAQSANRLPLDDPGEASTPTPVYSVARRLPFTFKFYGQRYDTITICANGWVAFGDQSYNDLFRNYQIPAMQAPDAMIAPYWDDLKTNGSGQGVYAYYDAANHSYVIQWKAGGGYSSFGTSLDFEVILLDTTYYPTFDGNGAVLVQYQTVQINLQGDSNDEPGCTVGIQNQTCTVGLNYLYETSYAPGAATLTTGRAILFTTNARMLFGQITGRVTDAASGLPLPNVNLSLDGYSYHTSSDSFGVYQLPDVLIGTYTLRARLHRYNDATTINPIVVQLDSTSTANLSMTHPVMHLSADSLLLTGDTSVVQTSFTIENTGNGPLDFNISIFYGGTGHMDPWDSVGGIPISDSTDNHLVQGCEFVGNEWWVTGGSAGQGPNLIYRFARNGSLLGTIPQPGTSAIGWFDLAYDGRYVYGSDAGDIVGIDRSGQVRKQIPSPVSPTHALAYDPVTHHFFAADYTTDIYELDTLGNIINRLPTPTGHSQLAITGLAWNPTDVDGYKLYIFSQNGNPALTRVSRMLLVYPYTIRTVVDLPGGSGDRAGGCTVTGGWNSTLLVFAAIIRNPTGDRMSLYELNFNTTWINISPLASTVPGGSVQPINLQLDPRQLIADNYRVTLHVASQVYDSTIVLPVRFDVADLVVPRHVGMTVPFEYALRQNYPNPFNPVTIIRYDLKEAGHTQLTVFDIMGRKVAELVNTAQVPGRYEVPFDAANLPSGLYFYRLQSGHFTSTSKMVLMK
jgi:hypothetical protein